MCVCVCVVVGVRVWVRVWVGVERESKRERERKGAIRALTNNVCHEIEARYYASSSVYGAGGVEGESKDSLNPPSKALRSQKWGSSSGSKGASDNVLNIFKTGKSIPVPLDLDQEGRVISLQQQQQRWQQQQWQQQQHQQNQQRRGQNGIYNS